MSMANTELVVRGIFLTRIAAKYSDGDQKFGFTARERLFRAPLFEAKIGDKTITGTKSDFERALGANLPPKLIAQREFVSFLDHAAMEVGVYSPFSIASALPVVQAPADDLTLVTPAPPAYSLSAKQIIDEIRANNAAYAVMTMHRGDTSTVWGRDQISDGGFSIVAGYSNLRFPFAQNTVETNNLFADQDPMDRHPDNLPDQHKIMIIRCTQQGISQIKIYLFAGDYEDASSPNRRSTALFVLNSKAELFDSIVRVTTFKNGKYANPDEAQTFAMGMLAIVNEAFPDTYQKSNCSISETNGLSISTYID